MALTILVIFKTINIRAKGLLSQKMVKSIEDNGKTEKNMVMGHTHGQTVNIMKVIFKMIKSREKELCTGLNKNKDLKGNGLMISLKESDTCIMQIAREEKENGIKVAIYNG